MGIEKPTGKILANRLEALAEVRLALTRLDVAANRKSTPEWKAQKAGLENLIKGIEHRAFDILGEASTDAVCDMMELKKLYGQRHAAQTFIDEVEDAEKYKERYRHKMKELEAEIADLRERETQLA